MKRISAITMAVLFLCACAPKAEPALTAQPQAEDAQKAEIEIGEAFTFRFGDPENPPLEPCMFVIAQVTNQGEGPVALGGQRYILSATVRDTVERPEFEHDDDEEPVRWTTRTEEYTTGGTEYSMGKGSTATVLQPGESAYVYAYTKDLPDENVSYEPDPPQDNRSARVTREILSVNREFLCTAAPTDRVEVRLPTELLYTREDEHGVYAGVKVDTSALDGDKTVFCGVICLDGSGNPFYVMEGELTTGEDGANMVARANHKAMDDYDPVKLSDIAGTVVYAYVVRKAG